jgi:uncharacterized protein (DUF1501 family)
MKANNPDKQNWDNDKNYNRRSMFQYLYGGSPLDVSEYDYTKYHWNSPVVPLDLTGSSVQQSSNYLRRFYQKLGLHSLKTTDTIVEAMKSDLGVDSLGSYGEKLFTKTADNAVGLNMNDNYGRMISDFNAVAKMLSLAKEENYRRQIFLIKLGGFDTHANQLSSHPALLRELSICLHHFNLALGELGLSDEVVTYSTSDFGRTVSNNGKGTDHGWGSHQLVMGGGIDKSEVVGKLPSLALGGDDDQKTQGRIIPSIANIQVQAELAHWFGVDKPLLSKIFPHLPNFQKAGDDLTSAFVNLGLKS